MKNLKSITILKRKNIIITIIAVTILCGSFSIWFYFNNYCKKYNKPEFASSYIEGKVDIDKEYGYSEMQVADEYKVGACGSPKADSNGVDLYFSNPQENNVLLKCFLLDGSETIVGETGLIKPNSYIKTVYFNTPQPKGDYDLTIKILGFEPETYYSKGIVNLKTSINIE